MRILPKPLPQGTVLDVPFADKASAKDLGALWCEDRAVWYAPPGADLSDTGLGRWLEKPDLSGYGLQFPKPRVIRNDGVWILQGRAHCPECGWDADVIAFACDRPETDDDEGEGEGSRVYRMGGGGHVAVLSGIDRLSRTWLTKARQAVFCAKYFGKKQGGIRFVNHCGKCQTPLPDDMLSGMPGQIFWPTGMEGAENIFKVHVEGPFEARCWSEGFPTALSRHWTFVREPQPKAAPATAEPTVASYPAR